MLRFAKCDKGEAVNILDIKELTFAYPDSNDDSGERYLSDALKNVTLSVGQGEFVVILGSSGCGKTTLLRQLKTSIAPHGRSSGKIEFKGRSLEEMDDRTSARQIGFVQQDVDAQLVTDKVWHELAFGLESLGYDNGYIRRRVAEMCSFFGLSGIFHRHVAELSGGQKQMVNLASVMALSPEVLILDEPTSQLDPIAANEFIACLVRINRELGTTIIMTEHRLEEVLPVCSRAVVMDEGTVLCQGTVKEVAATLKNEGQRLKEKGINRNGLYLSMPAAVQVYLGLDGSDESPVTVAEGRNWLSQFDSKYRESGHEVAPGYVLVDEGDAREADGQKTDHGAVETTRKIANRQDKSWAVRIDEVHFRYDKGSQEVLRGLDLDIYDNEILMINGSNGCGKSTLLSLIAGVNKPYRGRIKIKQGKSVGMLPQNPELLFTRRSVREELVDASDRKKLVDIVRFCKLEHLMDRHPYDLSGGEKQRLALAKVLLYDPDILLMDEPTKGLDNGFKAELKSMLRDLQRHGKTIVVVSHDVEFCAVAGDRIALLFDGELATVNGVQEYLAGNNFFTTAAARISQGILHGAVTVTDILRAYGVSDSEAGGEGSSGGDSRETRCEDADVDDDNRIPDAEITRDIVLTKERETDPLKWWQILTISVTSVIIIFCFWQTMAQSNLADLVQRGMTITSKGWKYLAMYGVMICAIAGLLLAIRPVTKKKNEDIVMEAAGHRSVRRTILSIVAMLVVIPLTIWFGCERLGDKKYYFISLLIIIEVMIPFFVSFEGRKPKVRDIVILAVMCALAVTGRAAFFMLPNFSPTMAIVIISGVAFGCEGGFVVGAMSMFVSNFLMGQGPWTPWQMFAMGLVGFMAGLFFSKSGVRTKNTTKLGLCIFGALICILIYGGIMNPASVIIWQPAVNRSMIIASYVTGFPFDVVHGTATVIFLWLLARPFLEKLDRVRIKYGVL